MAYIDEIKLRLDCEHLKSAVIKQAPDEVAELYSSFVEVVR